ncbi:hypothetical protein B0H65DRAFT_279875 [Neurospora tetraspora]|uniref:Uncharacterized protein n=1 Tax=Neurospora tetraspora TaxID=94610 RepID=A0AAE0MQB3_9PEZI|nr:hypothetical protein B0H65DRAFT_279875 [Neurospora tetraspora]
MDWSDHAWKAGSDTTTEGEGKTWTIVVKHECRNRLFHAIHCDLEVHLKGKGKSLQSFCIPISLIDTIGPDLDPEIQNVLCLHNWHRRLDASKLRKIFLRSMLASEDYRGFLVDMLRTNDNHQLSDDSLPIEGSQMRGLDEKYAEAFREFFWYQHLFLDGYCVGPCRFKLELEKATSQKPYLPSLYNEKDLCREKREVRSAALTLSLMSHSDCHHMKKN